MLQFSRNSTIIVCLSVFALFFMGCPNTASSPEKENTHSVRFDPNGGTGLMVDALVNDGAPFIVPSNAFKRANSSFAYWNTASDASGTSFDIGDEIPSVTSDMVLYAIWGETRTITFDPNGGEGVMAPVSLGDGGSFTVLSNEFTRAGTSFAYWNTKADGSGSRYDSGDVIETVSADIVLYAIWGVTRTISFDGNGGAGSMASVTLGDGGSFTVLACGFSRDNYAFSYWNTQSDGTGTRYDSGDVLTSVSSNITLYAIWGAIRTVSFVANGGTGTIMASVTVGDGGSFTVPACAYTLLNSSFAYWNTKADGSGQRYDSGDIISAISSDITLYAIWGAIRTVSFDSNDGTGTMTPVLIGDGGSFTVPACAFTRTGFNFVEWNTHSDGDGESYAAGDQISPVSGDITLYAVWNIRHRISFAANDGTGTLTSVTIGSGERYTVPACEFTRTGFNFVVWNTSPSGSGTAYRSGDTIPSIGSDMTLYAIWGAIRTITFVANGGTGTMASVTVGNGGSFTVPMNTFDRADYAFKEWNTQADGLGTGYGSGTIIAPVESDITLYATWTAIRTVSFSANGGSGSMNGITVNDGGFVTVPASTFSRLGYVFVEWNTQENGLGVGYESGDVLGPVVTNVTLYARWRELRTVTFSANGGSGTMGALSVANADPVTLPSCSFSRTGYRFVEWNTASDGSGAGFSAGDVIVSVTANIDLYAIWDTSWTITFNPNGGSGVMSPLTVDDGEPFTVVSNAYYRAGYRFSHWNTAANGTGISYSANDQIASVTSNQTLYAIWIALRTISFDSNGGTGSMTSVTVDDGSSFTIPSNGFYSAGNTFFHWSTTADDTGVSYAALGTIASVTSNITLYPIWRVTQVIQFNANGGSGSMLPAFVGNGMSCTLPASGFSRMGYVFGGWNTNSLGTGTTYAAGATFTASGDATLYAMWVGVTVTLNANGGSGPDDVTEMAQGAQYTVPPNGFARLNHTFVRWDTNPSGTGTSYAPGAEITVNANVTLYAIWIVNRTVSFNANGGTGSMESDVQIDGSSYTIPANEFTYTGHLFLGWNTNSAGTGTAFAPGAVITLTADMTLYPVWDANTVMFIDFEEGTDLTTYFTTVVDAAGTLSIQNANAAEGYALRKNLGSTHRLDVSWGEELTDFWVALDFYVESTDIMAAGTFSPLVLVCDSDRTWGTDETPYLIGTPVYNCYETETPAVGFTSIYPVSVMTPQTIVERFNIRRNVTPMLGQWHHLRYHVKFTHGDTEAGVDLWVDDMDTPLIHGIAVGADPDVYDFDLMRIWDHDTQAQPNTNIYLDNIGIYREDPELYD